MSESITTSTKPSKVKSDSFFQKLKGKIHALVDAENLSIFGRLFLLSLYICGLSIMSIVAISVVRSITDFVLYLLNISYSAAFFSGAAVVSWILFAITLIFNIVIAVVEAGQAATDGPSILITGDTDND